MSPRFLSVDPLSSYFAFGTIVNASKQFNLRTHLQLLRPLTYWSRSMTLGTEYRLELGLEGCSYPHFPLTLNWAPKCLRRGQSSSDRSHIIHRRLKKVSNDLGLFLADSSALWSLMVKIWFSWGQYPPSYLYTGTLRRYQPSNTVWPRFLRVLFLSSMNWYSEWVDLHYYGR